MSRIIWINYSQSGYPCTLMYHRYLANERLVYKNKYIKNLTNQIIGIYFISCGITTRPTAHIELYVLQKQYFQRTNKHRLNYPAVSLRNYQLGQNGKQVSIRNLINTMTSWCLGCVCNSQPKFKGIVIFGYTFTKILDHVGSIIFWGTVAAKNLIVRRVDASNALSEANAPDIPL